MWGTGLQLAENCVTDRLFFLSQAGIPKSEFLDSLRTEKARSLKVMSLLRGKAVASTVEFDGEEGLLAEEIQRVVAERMLTAKLVAAESSVPKPAPHELLGPGLPSAQGASTLGLGHI